MDTDPLPFADYVHRLHECSSTTGHAADRQVYQSLLSDAAVILSEIIRGCTADTLDTLIQQHDRLHGHTWLEGPEHSTVSEAWQRAKDSV